GHLGRIYTEGRANLRLEREARAHDGDDAEEQRHRHVEHRHRVVVPRVRVLDDAGADSPGQINAGHGLLLLHVAVVRHEDAQNAEPDGRVADDREGVKHEFRVAAHGDALLVRLAENLFLGDLAPADRADPAVRRGQVLDPHGQEEQRGQAQAVGEGVLDRHFVGMRLVREPRDITSRHAEAALLEFWSTRWSARGSFPGFGSC
ncbi:unnamed protein product, partial [Pelagomonas calceolata]